MKRYLAVAIIVAGVSLCAILYVSKLRSVSAQTNQNPTQTSPTPVRPNEGAIIGGPNAAASPAPPPTLQCQGCHGPGKQLPYLAGSLFHTEPHNGYDHSFHAQAIRNGTKAAACLDCHTRNGDMTTMLPASDPKSTINRANIAETCGRCHGDKTVMQGSGISNRAAACLSRKRARESHRSRQHERGSLHRLSQWPRHRARFESAIVDREGQHSQYVR